MTPEQLMQPRYIIIQDYPDCPYVVGAILNLNTDPEGNDYIGDLTDFVIFHPEKYPANLKKLAWWEDRKPEEMPEYVKTIPIFKTDEIRYFKGDNWFIYEINDSEMIGIRTPGGICGAHSLQPINEQEYIDYINKTQ